MYQYLNLTIRYVKLSADIYDCYSVFADSTLKLSLLERLEIMETKLTFSLDGSAAGLTTNSVVQVSTFMLYVVSKLYSCTSATSLPTCWLTELLYNQLGAEYWHFNVEN